MGYPFPVSSNMAGKSPNRGLFCPASHRVKVVYAKIFVDQAQAFFSAFSIAEIPGISDTPSPEIATSYDLWHSKIMSKTRNNTLTKNRFNASKTIKNASKMHPNTLSPSTVQIPTRSFFGMLLTHPRKLEN